MSNVRLRVYDQMEDHNILELLERGLCVTVNSDDPAYFGGDLLENFAALETAKAMTREQAVALVKNSFEGSYLDDDAKADYLSAVEQYASQS